MTHITIIISPRTVSRTPSLCNIFGQRASNTLTHHNISIWREHEHADLQNNQTIVKFYALETIIICAVYAIIQCTYEQSSAHQAYDNNLLLNLFFFVLLPNNNIYEYFVFFFTSTECARVYYNISFDGSVCFISKLITHKVLR